MATIASVSWFRSVGAGQARTNGERRRYGHGERRRYGHGERRHGAGTGPRASQITHTPWCRTGCHAKAQGRACAARIGESSEERGHMQGAHNWCVCVWWCVCVGGGGGSTCLTSFSLGEPVMRGGTPPPSTNDDSRGRSSIRLLKHTRHTPGAHETGQRAGCTALWIVGCHRSHAYVRNASRAGGAPDASSPTRLTTRSNASGGTRTSMRTTRTWTVDGAARKQHARRRLRGLRVSSRDGGGGVY
jgi:hypothetical protein